MFFRIGVVPIQRRHLFEFLQQLPYLLGTMNALTESPEEVSVRVVIGFLKKIVRIFDQIVYIRRFFRT